MERSTVEVLKAAREKIAKPEAWTKGALARAKSGRAIEPLASGAACWCVLGALVAANSLVTPAFNVVRKAIGNGRDIGDFNDDPATAHADVLAMFDKAIALAEQEQA